MNFWAYKQNGALKPATSDDKQKVNKIAVGQPEMFKHVRVRNPKLHRKYFAFFGLVWGNLPEKYEQNWPTKTFCRT